MKTYMKEIQVEERKGRTWVPHVELSMKEFSNITGYACAAGILLTYSWLGVMAVGIGFYMKNLFAILSGGLFAGLLIFGGWYCANKAEVPTKLMKRDLKEVID